MRAIRKVTSYICTACFRSYPTSAEANKHVNDAHGKARQAAKAPKKRRGVPQVERVYNAIHNGAKSAKEVERRTRIPLTRVHSLLTYLRNRDRIEGYSGELKAL